ncbi:hypothetical protein X975_24456, partial [Stegodyphus mimosarum]
MNFLGLFRTSCFSCSNSPYWFISDYYFFPIRYFICNCFGLAKYYFLSFTRFSFF